MIQFLVRKFIPDADNIQDARVRGRYGTLSGALGIFFNLLLFLVKIPVSYTHLRAHET